MQRRTFSANAFSGGLYTCFWHESSFPRKCRTNKGIVETVPHRRRKNATLDTLSDCP